MKIMIVEDEVSIREGLAQMIDWGEERFEQPILFEGAIEALQYLEKETVDIIITDLYMPILNGIEFIQMLRESNQMCDIIILSGHERFDLAQEAMRLGVKRYLLKPVSAEKLRQILQEVRHDIEERMKLKDWVRIAEKKLDQYIPVMKNQFWNDLLTNRNDRLENVAASMKELEITTVEDKFCCIALWKKEEMQQNKLTEELALQQLAAEIIPDRYLYGLPYENMEIFIINGDVRRDKIEILKESIRQNLNIEVYFGIGTTVEDITEVRKSAAQAAEAVRFICNGSTMFYMYYKDIRRIENTNKKYPYDMEHKITKMLRFHDTLDESMTKNFLREIMSPKVSIEESRKELLQFLGVLGRLADEFGVEILKEFEDTEQAITNYDRVEEKFLTIMDIFARAQSNASKRYIEIMVEEAKQKIEKEYSDPGLTVASLAGHIGVTPNYLSRIFGSITGRTCMEYITNTRMRAAQEMLKYTGKRSYMIAEEAGYRNPNYFSVLFKKYTGLSPKEYRERNAS
ncbi:YesN/AraC family two-component response regulator [Muricomes intestini]|uniref:Stage 0 sporulation protein A homolog n=2 Tax=Muricomes intestini TaxID=1796634 RepID=A0A4R3K347_9FIRM|nr:response regulator [Muricomes intestini]TCS77108.1 YesN/AraC family two-component response regulator [Muricomes intestini]